MIGFWLIDDTGLRRSRCNGAFLAPRDWPLSFAWRNPWRDLADVAALRAMPQRLVHQHQRQHRLADWRGADADAGIVATGGDDVDFVAFDIHAARRQAQAGGRLERDRTDDLL